MTKYGLTPINGKILFEKVNLSDHQDNSIQDPLDIFEEQMYAGQTKSIGQTEVFKYVSGKIDQLSLLTHQNIFVYLSTYEPIGVYNGKQYYIADEKSISVIIKINEEDGNNGGQEDNGEQNSQ